ncbi:MULTISPECIES: nuclease domain-containing protein [unclassified Luteibacter]|uniref:nuclease domain-containing protein n=1 Tax=Luteibacter sp. PvP019 TaxID=3156436 RepID=UPI003391842F
MARGKALGRVPQMGSADGAKAAPDVMARPKRKAPMRASRPAMTPLRKSAQDEGCTIRKAGVCLYDPKTVVLAHLRWLGDCGGSLKPMDLQAVYACSECNRWTDSPSVSETRDRAAYEAERNFYCLRALVRTWMRMIAKGLITVKGIAA